MTKAIEAWVKRNQNHFKDSNEKNHLIEFLTHEYANKNSINFSHFQCVIKAEEWVRELNKKSNVSVGRIKEVMNFGNLKIVRLLDQDSRSWEGSLMKHCVASYTDQDELYSLRDAENIPHCTIEVKEKKIRQIKGKANGAVKPEYIAPVLKFLNEKKIKVSSNEMKNIGYQKLKTTSFFKNNFKNPEFIKLLGETYMYMNNKLILKRSFKNKEIKGLRYFCKTGQSMDALKQFFSNGIDIKKNSLSLLLLAVENKNLELVKYFVSSGINIKSKKFGRQILTRVCTSGNLEIAQVLVSNGLRVDANYYNFLYDCTYSNKLNILRFLTKESGKEILTQNKLTNGYESADLEFIKILVEKGLSQSGKNLALYYVTRSDAPEDKIMDSVAYLLSIGATHEGGLVNSIYCKNFKVAKFLIEKREGVTQYAMFMAILSQNVETIRLLMSAGLKVTLAMSKDYYLIKVSADEYKAIKSYLKTEGITLLGKFREYKK